MDEEGSARYQLHLQNFGTLTTNRQVNCEAKIGCMHLHNTYSIYGLSAFRRHERNMNATRSDENLVDVPR